MIVDCISDLHGSYPKLCGGDLLIVAGDLTAQNLKEQYFEFFAWLDKQEYERIIVVAGNHDGLFLRREYINSFLSGTSRIDYLCDSGAQVEDFKVWGSPWTPTFYNWYFMRDRGEEIKAKWDLIPDDTDILVTHGPPMGIQDEVKYSSKANNGRLAGCEELRIAVNHRLKNLKLHVFGHIHESAGKAIVNGVTYVNACIMNEDYSPVHTPTRVVL